MAETEKFNQMGSDWWNPKGKMAALHMINEIRFQYFEKIIGKPKGKKILDIGCGGGLLSEEFAKRGAHVTGVDLSPVAIEAAKKHARENDLNIDYRNCALTEIKDNNFDVVVCAEMLEHVEDLQQIIIDSTIRLKSGGHYLFETINKTASAWFLSIFMAENVLNFVGKGTHNYDRFVKPSHLVSLLSTNGVSVREVKGMTFKPLEWQFVISDSTQVNYIGYGIKN
ncbi:MAG: bifunctional 2-polyprenyl-6-hydroxyphenol methylase/3-demethylubiquinol 3-O-methyltransferase UbiG [Proteobacteria bacterium]|nr:bifunctional 2-polyprenyl-6-hydroxyphenol methylase/3-demethylubiquinol 3-O-methyltransferase UbiG [Pseudomonadota bacterium]